MPVNLSEYNNSDYKPGGGILKRTLWYITNSIVFNSWLSPGSKIKCNILRIFGATIGKDVVIKPRVNIKYPWHLSIANDVWIGEGVWIDNLTTIKIKSNVCLSQGAYLLTGNHNYKDSAFGLIVKGITIDEGAWIGARAIITPGVQVGRESIITVNSVLQKNSLAQGIYQGNPAIWVRERIITNQ